MVEQGFRPPPPILTPLQAAWLEELGLGRRFVAQYLPPAAEGARGGQAEAAASAPSLSAASQPQPASMAGPGLGAASVAPAMPASADPAPGRTMFQAGQLAAALLAKHPTVKPATGQPPAATAASHAPAPPAAAVGSVAVALPSSPSSAFESLRLRVEACTACGLHGERHLPVVGSGAAETVDLMVIGEAPGAEDDRVGQPFRGKAGELLQAMLKAAGITDQARVHFTHLLKCRPVGNRAPSADEVAACLAHLRQQIALAQPRQLLVLGRVAAQALLGDVPVEALRGRLHTYSQEGMAIPVVVTYHPAALLSRPRHKAAAWQDLSLLEQIG